MLANYLKGIRAAKKVTSQTALAQLNGWSEGSNGALTKKFEFEDFHAASNFLKRYTDYCQAQNMTPQWSNVYNRVEVTLHNPEFGGVTAKEVSAGSYLDLVSKSSLHQDIEDVMSFA